MSYLIDSYDDKFLDNFQQSFDEADEQRRYGPFSHDEWMAEQHIDFTDIRMGVDMENFLLSNVGRRANRSKDECAQSFIVDRYPGLYLFRYITMNEVNLNCTKLHLLKRLTNHVQS